eukprot:snap_masked-scaffold418_size177226-processed-gene-0.29 protein:Tk10807 transcript:snap_masked-scaffold418_size177226-processed-gene-0.29-mRNA-1 annotation:"fructose -bisphosphatase"
MHSANQCPLEPNSKLTAIGLAFLSAPKAIFTRELQLTPTAVIECLLHIGVIRRCNDAANTGNSAYQVMELTLNRSQIVEDVRMIELKTSKGSEMSDMRTLGEFIIEKQHEYPHASGELSSLLSSIRLAAKIVNREINKAGLADITGAFGGENVQGEEQQKLDVYANDKFKAAMAARDQVCGVASEEEDDAVIFDNAQGHNAKYVILMDPLDGSSNIDVNVSVGTIFSIYRRVSPTGGAATMEDFLQPGNQQVAAGYIIYGSSTMLVYTTASCPG